MGRGVAVVFGGRDVVRNQLLQLAKKSEQDNVITDTREALRTLILGIKAGKADHLL